MIPVGPFPNPFGELAANAIGKVITDSWTAAMLGLWQAGLWALRFALVAVDALTTPDLSETGPNAAIYRTTFWLAGVVMIAMLLVQLGVAAFRRNGQSLAVGLVGAFKFVVVWAGWLAYGAAVVFACSGISRALMRSLLGVDSWAVWQPWEPVAVEDVTDASVATVLGLMGLSVWMAAIGHLVVMIARAGTLLVLAAVTPIAAAGLLAEAGQGWFWKSFRWFHTAAFTPVLMVVMLGLGVQLTGGVVTGPSPGILQAGGTALVGVILIVIATFSPLALFKWLAFTDPSTPSGSAFRSALSAAGGLPGLVRLVGGRSGGDGAAGLTDDGVDPDMAADQDITARFSAAEVQTSRSVDVDTDDSDRVTRIAPPPEASTTRGAAANPSGQPGTDTGGLDAAVPETDAAAGRAARADSGDGTVAPASPPDPARPGPGLPRPVAGGPGGAVAGAAAGVGEAAAAIPIVPV